MDVVELQPNEEEINAFEEEEMGEEWPEDGMRCPVVGCLSGDHWIGHLASYWSYYHRYHHRVVSVYKCPRCGFKDIKMSEIRRHLRRAHKVTSDETVRSEAKPNTKFVDPKGVRRPRPRIYREERDHACEERQRSAPSAPLFTLSDHNPRDEKCPVGGFKK